MTLARPRPNRPRRARQDRQHSNTAGGNATNDEVRIVGATGRVGRAVTARLAARGLTLVPVGRSRERMIAVGADAGLPSDAKVVVADSAERIADEITGSIRAWWFVLG